MFILRIRQDVAKAASSIASKLAHDAPNRAAMMNAPGFIDQIAVLLQHENPCKLQRCRLFFLTFP